MDSFIIRSTVKSVEVSDKNMEKEVPDDKKMEPSGTPSERVDSETLGKKKVELGDIPDKKMGPSGTPDKKVEPSAPGKKLDSEAGTINFTAYNIAL